MKELTKAYGDLLQDKRVRSEQARYESFTKQRNQVLTKYNRIFQAFQGLIDGLMRAQSFYTEMRDTIESLEKNVETFVSNRRAEGAQLLGQIERDKLNNAGAQADRERDRLRELMERMSMDPSSSPIKSTTSRPVPFSQSSQNLNSHHGKSPVPSTNYYPMPSSTPTAASMQSPAPPNRIHSPETIQSNGASTEPPKPGGIAPNNDPYNPMAYPFQSSLSPPARQGLYYPNNASAAHQPYPQYVQFPSQGYVPPPPPPGPPPPSQMTFGNPDLVHPNGPGGYAYHQPPRPSGAAPSLREQHDPWAGLNTWK